MIQSYAWEADDGLLTPQDDNIEGIMPENKENGLSNTKVPQLANAMQKVSVSDQEVDLTNDSNGWSDASFEDSRESNFESARESMQTIKAKETKENQVLDEEELNVSL